MCGILGVAGPPGVERVAPRVASALDALEHRGPDARNVRTVHGLTSAVVLGHTRLRIVDLSTAADQPIANEDETVWVIYNGELYNAPELRRELEAAGHRFASRTDTEILVHLYEHTAGDVPRMLGRLRGMFAFALFDIERDRLVLGRDRLGIKPLYWCGSSGTVAFGSEVRAIVRAGFAAAEPDPTAVAEYLVWGSVGSPGTIVRGIRSLEPGEFLDRTPSSTRVDRWWSPSLDPDADVGADATRLVRAALDDAVGRHLVADRPVGVFLSGGVDSGAVARLARREGAVRGLTVTFPEVPGPEGQRAARSAARWGIDHVEVPVKGTDVAADLGAIVGAMDQPTADGVNTWLVSRAARDAGLVVALSGLGGDELFGGYPSFRLVPRVHGVTTALRLAPTGVRRSMAAAIAERSPGSRSARVLTAAPGFEGAYAAIRQLFSPGELRAAGVRLARTSPSVLHDGSGDARDRVMLLELGRYLPSQLLRDTDQMSMAHSIEVRVPLLDDVVVRAALAIPASVRTAASKALLCRAAGIRPRTKIPFALPFDHWLRRPLREPVREALVTQDLPFAHEIPASFRRRLWESFEDGRTHWSRVWAIAVLRMWPGANGFRW